MNTKTFIQSLCALGTAITISTSAMAIPTNFDVTSITTLNAFGATAVGTSNGIGWTLGPTYFSSCCGASTTGGYNGFNNANFITPVANSDALHITSDDFDLTFDQAISSIVFYLRENGGSASLDFGIAPTLISGVANLNVIGTRVFTNTSGGAIRYSGLNTTTLSHTSAIFDGLNLAFYVESVFIPEPPTNEVAEPGTLALFGLGLAGLGLARRRKVA